MTPVTSNPRPAPGTLIPALVRGPMTTQHLMRWSAAIENWHRIHYDQPFAVGHDHLRGLLVNGSWKQHVLAQMLKDWAGVGGWVADLNFQYRSADISGDTITAYGRVTACEPLKAAYLVRCEIGIKNQREEHSTVGTATVVLAATVGGDIHAARAALGDRHLPPVVDAGHRLASAHVTTAMLDRVAVPGVEVFAPEPVDLSSVRRMAQAIMDDDPMYYDEAAAKERGHEGVVAPALFPLHIHRRHAGEPDPLNSAIENLDSDGAGDVVTKHGLAPLDIDLPRLLNAGNEIQIFDQARLDDMLASTSTISDIHEKAGKSGPLVFVLIDTEFRAVNRDALLLRGRQSYVYR